MSSLVLRKFNSENICSDCDSTIAVASMYWTGPNKSQCIKCHDEEKENGSSRSKSTDDSYVVSGTCKYCEQPAVGILWNKKVCAGHINQVITEEI